MERFQLPSKNNWKISIANALQDSAAQDYGSGWNCKGSMCLLDHSVTTGTQHDNMSNNITHTAIRRTKFSHSQDLQ